MRVGLAGLAVLLALFLAPPADAFIYWAESSRQTIGRANNDGSGVEESFIPTGALPFAVTVDSSHIYWVDQGGDSIGRANIDGTGVENDFITGVNEPSGVAVTSSFIYWATLGGPIGRANIDGSKPQPNFVVAAQEPCGLAVDSGHVYWADDSFEPVHIGRSSLDGSFVQAAYVTVGAAFPCGVAVNSVSIFWADTGFFGGGTKIGRANVSDGKGVDLSFVAGASTPCGVALDDESHLYWANAGSNTIGRANTDGSGVDQSFLHTGAGTPCGVAVDSLSAPSQPPGPPGPAPDTVAPQTKITRGPGGRLAKGTASFRFASSEAGSSFRCRLDRRRPRPCRSPKRYTHLRPGRHTFRVWALDAAGNRDPTPARRRFRVPAN